MKNNYHFNRNQLLALASIILLSPIMRLFPHAASDYARQAAALSAPAAIPVMLMYIYLITELMDARLEGEGIGELCLRFFGEKAGKVLLFVISGWLLLYGGFILRAGGDRLITTIYPYSNPKVFIVIMGILSVFAALTSARTIVRSAKIILPLVYGLIIFIIFFSFFSISKENLLPVTIDDTVPVLKSSLAAVNVLTGIIFFICFFAAFMPKKEHGFRDYSIWICLMVLLISCLCITVVGSFGAELTSNLAWPFFSLVRNLVFFHSLQRIEALVVSLWIFPDFLLASMLMYSAQHCIRLALGEKSPAYSGEKLFCMKKKRWVIPLCGVITIVCGLLISPSPVNLDVWSTKIIPLINFVFVFLFIPCLYFYGKAKKKL